MTVVQSVLLDILELNAKNDVLDIAQTIKPVITLVDCALMGVMMDILENTVTTLVKRDLMAKLVLWFAILTAQRVETQTDFALVAQVG